MTDRSDTIDRWVGDYCTSAAFVDHPSLVREYAPEVLTAFLTSACGQRDAEPAQISEADLKPALLEGVAPIEIPGSVRGDIPELAAAFLTEMEAQGRLSGGRTLGLYVRALREAYVAAAAGKPQPFQAAARKLGRNEPCPCGSGRKYKKCCLGLLGS